jgi:CopG family transcriptional regulator, nickel-responsive regulator
MKDPLVRFGVAIEGSLLRQLDALAEERGCTRSELLRDLARAAVGRAKVPKGVEAVGALTLVYDHHVRDLSEKLTDLQHQLGEGVRAALHVHLSHELCLEVVVVRGRSHELQSMADRILAMRGVKHGGIEIIAGLPTQHGYGHSHNDGHSHGHSHDQVSADGTGRSIASEPEPDGPRAAPVRTGTGGSRGAPPRRGRSRRG